MRGELGDTLSPFPIDKVRMSTNQIILGSILSKKIRITKTHYFDGVGYVHCFEGVCCQSGKLPTVKYLFPFIKYNTDLLGNLLVSPENMTLDDCSVMILDLSKESYQTILTKNTLQEKQGSDITKIDLMIMCTDQTYQKKNFDVAGPASWRVAKLFDKQSYIAVLKEFHKHAEAVLGREMNEVQFAQALQNATPSTPQLDRPQAGSPQQPQQQQLPSKVMESEEDFDSMFGADNDDIPF